MALLPEQKNPCFGYFASERRSPGHFEKRPVLAGAGARERDCPKFLFSGGRFRSFRPRPGHRDFLRRFEGALAYV